MFIFVYIMIYVVIIMAVILSHIFTGRYMSHYDTGIETHAKELLAFIEKAEKTGNWKLNKKQMRKFRKPQVLESFYRVSQELDRKKLEQFLEENTLELVELGRKMRNKSLRAYYAFVICKLQLKGKIAEQFTELVLYYLRTDSSVFCRENSLKALYSMGNAKSISEAFKYFHQKDIYHSEKLLTDGLLSYQGDFKKLSKVLVDDFEDYGQCCRIAVISYLFYRDEHDFDGYFMNYLKQDISMDERCGCLRLIGKQCSKSHEKLLIQTLESYKDKEDWEPAAVAASALGNYKDKLAIAALEGALESPNWYVRINSARALVAADVAVLDVKRILGGKDEYAKDALKYAISS